MAAIHALCYAGCRKPFTAGAISRPLQHNSRRLRCQADHTERDTVNRRALLLTTAALGGEDLATGALYANAKQLTSYVAMQGQELS